MRLPMTVSATVAPAPAVTSLTTEVSFDDGQTWTAATVNRTSSGWQAQYEQPAAAGTWVSLRSALATADGATTTQTILHAYKLR
jgi:hypothetical protein